MKPIYLIAISAIFILTIFFAYNTGRNTQTIVSEITPTSPIVAATTSIPSQNNLVIIKNIKLNFPIQWTKTETVTSQDVSFITQASPFKIILNLQVSQAMPSEVMVGDLIGKNKDGATFYTEVGLGGNRLPYYILKYPTVLYRFAFDYTSTQPAPENLDGVWSPDKNISDTELESILQSSSLDKGRIAL